MRVLVTGGGGFIGSHLIEHQIRQGHAVRTIDLHTEKLSHCTVFKYCYSGKIFGKSI
jgi:nucleoside-diphosphate-sugar epimerase